MIYRFEIEDKTTNCNVGFFVGIGRFELGDVDDEIYNLLDKLSTDLIAPEICKNCSYNTVSYYTESGYKKYKKYLLKLCNLINKYFSDFFEMKKVELKDDCINGYKVYEDDFQVAYILK